MTDTAHARRPRGAARRDALLEATLALVGERGADAVTHRAVAERAGLPLASTTYWFASKDELLTEALRHAAERDTARVRATAADVIAATAAEATAAPLTPAAVVDALLDPGTEPTPDAAGDRGAMLAAYSLLLEAARRPALRAIAEDWTRAYLETFGELLARAGSARPAGDARLLVAALDGLQIDRLADGRGGPPHDDLRPELVRLVTALLRAGGR